MRGHDCQAGQQLPSWGHDEPSRAKQKSDGGGGKFIIASTAGGAVPSGRVTKFAKVNSFPLHVVSSQAQPLVKNITLFYGMAALRRPARMADE